MTVISAKVICDSVNTAGDRLATLELTYPRFIHSEVMTHRVFSRNAASSRAIPLRKQRAAIWQHPAEPIFWSQNQKGMQGHEELTGLRAWGAWLLWSHHRWTSIYCNWGLEKLGLHKQYANRLCEAHMHITTLVSSTSWANFLHLRTHKDAQPEFRQLARRVQEALASSVPVVRVEDEWHLPYITQEDTEQIAMWDLDGGKDIWTKLKLVSAARCARVSYTTFEHSVKSVVQDYALGQKLLAQEVLHASPLEHQAQADPDGDFSHCWGNFRGWIQHRKAYHKENIPDKLYIVQVLRNDPAQEA